MSDSLYALQNIFNAIACAVPQVQLQGVALISQMIQCRQVGGGYVADVNVVAHACAVGS